MLPFAVGSKTFPFEAHVIQDLTCDVILGRNFFQKFVLRLILMRVLYNNNSELYLHDYNNIALQKRRKHHNYNNLTIRVQFQL